MAADVFKALGIGNGREFASRQQRLAEVDAELAASTFLGTSRDNIASVAVNGRGELIDVVISDQALRSPHPELVGPAVVEAVRQARAEAGIQARAAISDVLHPGSTAPAQDAPEPAAIHSEPAQPRQGPPQVPTRRKRTQEDDDDFGDLDFLAT